MSDEAVERLRTRLRSEAGPGVRPAQTIEREKPSKVFRSGGRRGRIANFFKKGILTPAAVLAALLLIGGAWGLYALRRGEVGDLRRARVSLEKRIALELSGSLLVEAAGDHRTCAPHAVGAVGPVEMPESVKAYDPACAKLAQVASKGARGLALRSAHVCGFGGRRFAHLVYTRDAKSISLLVTARDERALKTGKVPSFDSAALGEQRFTQDQLALGAYQTAKHIVLVVSDLPESENAVLAESLAKPVVEHFQQAELSSSVSGVGDRSNGFNLGDLTAMLRRY
jgi:hypothetical protein